MALGQSPDEGCKWPISAAKHTTWTRAHRQLQGRGAWRGPGQMAMVTPPHPPPQASPVPGASGIVHLSHTQTMSSGLEVASSFHKRGNGLRELQSLA